MSNNRHPLLVDIDSLNRMPGRLNGQSQLNQPTELERRLEETRGGLEIELGKLSAKPGDVVLVRIPPNASSDLVAGVRDVVKAAMPDGVHWIGLVGDMQLEHVTAEDMAKLGWVRAEAESA